MNFISTRRALLRLLFSMLANQIVQANELEILPEAENDEQVIEAGSTLTLTCINESPHHLSDNLTELRWILPQFKNPLIEETDNRFSLTDVKNETHLISTMTLTNITTNDTGFYECQGRIQPRNRYVYVFSNEDFDLTGPPNLSSNKLEAKTSIFDPITFLEEEKHEINVPTLTATLIGLCAFCVGIFGIKIHLDKRKMKRQLEKMLNGDPSRIDPEVPLEYQTEFLPYDRKWEFPRKRLRLGQELGSGCFGRVVKGEAVGIKDSDETVTTVAVKMTKLTAKSHNALDVLIRELKMMIHLWEHLNIVNLMGACTNTNIKEEILVIIEFCKFGDLKSYLIKHRDQFINELNALGNMPPTNETAANDFTQHPSVAMKLVNEISELQTHEPAHVTEMPERDQIYKSRKDSDANFTQIIKTSDLISWSYQIARGMEFLASKKVLHGDLAARNVLLADHGIVKVADFGMARQMKDYEYEKKGEELFPVQWMAIESLTINIFSSQSDVWSYGVLLWEIFSLGNVPYPGMENGWVLVREIQNGCRMEKPEYSPNFLGEIMKNCWQKNPNERPTFSQLAGVIEKQIESLGSLDYLNMNRPAVGQTDETKVHSNSNKSLENC